MKEILRYETVSMVEHSAVNRVVVGSSLARGALSKKDTQWMSFFVLRQKVRRRQSDDPSEGR